MTAVEAKKWCGVQVVGHSRVPGGDRVAVRVGVVEMGRGNGQKGQGRRD